MTKFVRTQKKNQASNFGEIERIYGLWEDALGKKDLEAALALYADDGSVESPLARHLLKADEGIVKSS